MGNAISSLRLDFPFASTVEPGLPSKDETSLPQHLDVLDNMSRFYRYNTRGSRPDGENCHRFHNKSTIFGSSHNPTSCNNIRKKSDLKTSANVLPLSTVLQHPTNQRFHDNSPDLGTNGSLIYQNDLVDLLKKYVPIAASINTANMSQARSSILTELDEMIRNKLFVASRVQIVGSLLPLQDTIVSRNLAARDLAAKIRSETEDKDLLIIQSDIENIFLEIELYQRYHMRMLASLRQPGLNTPTMSTTNVQELDSTSHLKRKKIQEQSAAKEDGKSRSKRVKSAENTLNSMMTLRKQLLSNNGEPDEGKKRLKHARGQVNNLESHLRFVNAELRQRIMAELSLMRGAISRAESKLLSNIMVQNTTQQHMSTTKSSIGPPPTNSTRKAPDSMEFLNVLTDNVNAQIEANHSV